MYNYRNVTLNTHIDFFFLMSSSLLFIFFPPWLGLYLPVCPRNTSMFSKSLALALSSVFLIDSIWRILVFSKGSIAIYVPVTCKSAFTASASLLSSPPAFLLHYLRPHCYLK